MRKERRKEGEDGVKEVERKEGWRREKEGGKGEEGKMKEEIKMTRKGREDREDTAKRKKKVES